MAADNISILYDHYKDTCAIIRSAIKQRDRLMVLVVAVVGFFAFESIFPGSSNQVINDYLNFKFGLTFKIDLALFGNIIWFILLATTLRYFQTAVFIERQYKYIHAVEDKLNKHTEKELVTREGKSYLADYPKFSDWMWALYTIVFPLILLLVSTFKILKEWFAGCNNISASLLFDSLIFLLLAISIILYLLMIHSSKNKTHNEQTN